MNKFGANTIAKWYDVLDVLSTIKITGYGNIKIFISLLTKFGVTYDNNFRLFMSKLNEFSPNFMPGAFGLLTKFINDMTATGNTYRTENGIRVVNGIIDYFVQYGFTLYQYYPNAPVLINGCSDLPENHLSILVNALYSYDQSVTQYQNRLYDIQFNPNRKFNKCDLVTAMNEAYMLCTMTPTYNNQSAVIISNIALIAAFFYKEEMDAIIRDPNHYSNINMRIRLMDGISNAMTKYVEKLKTEPQYAQQVELYTAISNVIKIFPCLSFQYLSNEFMSKKLNENESIYSIHTNPDYTMAKASTKVPSINLRQDKPVV
jgi:hypothetical protein